MDGLAQGQERVRANPAQEQATVGGKLPREQALPDKTLSPKSRMTQGKKTKGDTI